MRQAGKGGDCRRGERGRNAELADGGVGGGDILRVVDAGKAAEPGHFEDGPRRPVGLIDEPPARHIDAAGDAPLRGVGHDVRAAPRSSSPCTRRHVASSLPTIAACGALCPRKIRILAAIYPSIPPCRSRWSGVMLRRTATSKARLEVSSS